MPLSTNPGTTLARGVCKTISAYRSFPRCFSRPVGSLTAGSHLSGRAVNRDRHRCSSGRVRRPAEREIAQAAERSAIIALPVAASADATEIGHPISRLRIRIQASFFTPPPVVRIVLTPGAPSLRKTS